MPDGRVGAGPQLEVGCTSRVEIFTTDTLRPEDGFDQVDCQDPMPDGRLAEYEAGGTKRRVKATMGKSLFYRFYDRACRLSALLHEIHVETYSFISGKVICFEL